MNKNNENENNNSSRNNPTINTDNNDKEKYSPENKNIIKFEEKEDNNSNINTWNDSNDPKINHLINVSWSKIAEELENKNARKYQAHGKIKF